tara:strand:- start:333 stop:1301 length:969 start_codon:yes stop_codon:yes gene_type:complete
MNNYSWLQQKLHSVALSSQLMREVTFDVEVSLSSKESCQDDHVFVAGLARSGTTTLLNALYNSHNFASLTYEDMPFVLSPNLWSKLTPAKRHTEPVERAHGDGITVSTDSPEAFEEVFWKTFNDKDHESHEKFKTYISCITKKYNKKRYLSKNNQNIRRLRVINEIFPNSQILIPFRDPIQHAFSLLTQHKKFIDEVKKDNFIFDYMEWIGHTEFGQGYTCIHPYALQFTDSKNINHWLEQWFLTYEDCLKLPIKRRNFNFICYESLCTKKESWINILKLTGIKNEYAFEFRESKKDVAFKINPELLAKCNSVYDELVNLSI